uniref:NADH-ubiquinone oxidoreductase chain 2 n=1 Tax=Buergeria buergeri TaxID=191197 RepID=Q6L7I6_BUEBU|nr:NADH dehydrogenase subunit 2 [Buergeria buergeri]
MNPIAYTMFLTSLAIGTSITLLSHHWLLAWVGLEINTLAIIPIMTKTPHPRAIEAATKYFLTQATASAIILFSALTNAWKTGQWDMMLMTDLHTSALSIALMMKLGLAPLHFWMPEVLQGIPLLTGLILSTWQKIAPMTIIIQVSQSTNTQLIITIGLLSILVGGWAGINQTQLRKILAFSSIGHLGWMMIVLKFNPQLTLFNFMIYILMTAAMFSTLMIISATKMLDISTSWSKIPTLTPIMLLTLLSLAGLPPLTGFSPKLLISVELIKQDSIMLAATAMLASLLAMFFYLRLTYIMTLTTPPNTSPSLLMWNLTTKINPTVTTLNICTIMMLPLTPSILMMM